MPGAIASSKTNKCPDRRELRDKRRETRDKGQRNWRSFEDSWRAVTRLCVLTSLIGGAWNNSQPAIFRYISTFPPQTDPKKSPQMISIRRSARLLRACGSCVRGSQVVFRSVSTLPNNPHIVPSPIRILIPTPSPCLYRYPPPLPISISTPTKPNQPTSQLTIPRPVHIPNPQRPGPLTPSNQSPHPRTRPRHHHRYPPHSRKLHREPRLCASAPVRPPQAR